MNIFSIVYERITGHSAQAFCDHVDRELLLDLIKGTQCVSDNNDNCCRRLTEVVDILSNESRSQWLNRNPELFVPVTNILAFPGKPHVLVESISQLEHQLGLSVSHVHRFWRNFGADPFVKSFTGEQWTDVAEIEIKRLSNSDCLIIGPFDGLYSDIFSEDIYPSALGDCTFENARAMLEQAVILLDLYSTETLEDLKNAVRLFAITGGGESPSFSYRLSYAGGIFLNPNHARTDFLEAILHEYLHLRLWQWWAYDPVPGANYADRLVLSPITGNLRSSLSLLQAFLIYVALFDLNAFLVENGCFNDRALAIKQSRIVNLWLNVPKLADLLKYTFHASSARHYIDTIFEIFLETSSRRSHLLKDLAAGYTSHGAS